jgi:hypothetical protein
MGKFLELMESWDGYRPMADRRLSEAAMARALDLLTNARGVPTHRHRYEMEEAITTSDFPTLFGGILDRGLMARYSAVKPAWRAWVPVGRLADFRQAELHKVQGNDTRLDKVAEKAAYPLAPMATAHYHRQLFKYGRMFDISWESIINDAMGAMQDIEERFLEAALLSEAWEATGTYASATGPNSALFGATITDVDGQAITNQGVLALTIANIQTTLGLMAKQTDVNGRTLSISGVHLVVPKMLEFTALQALTSAYVQQVDTAGGANATAPTFVPLGTTNVLPRVGLQLHVDDNLAAMDVSGNGDGTWYMFANKGATQMDFLAGHESPEICMKASDKVSTGGGTISPFEGDFESDDVKYRVRHCFGGTQLDPRYAYAQVSA